MALEFVKCEKCGKIFNRADLDGSLCPACAEKAEEDNIETDHRDYLRELKTAIRDIQARGEFVSVPDLEEITSIPQTKIWDYIHSGDIDLASFDDPQVRSFLQRQRLERQRESARRTDPKSSTATKKKEKRGGFHLRSDGDKRR